jgi:hypothetical protein
MAPNGCKLSTGVHALSFINKRWRVRWQKGHKPTRVCVCLYVLCWWRDHSSLQPLNGFEYVVQPLALSKGKGRSDPYGFVRWILGFHLMFFVRKWIVNLGSWDTFEVFYLAAFSFAAN